MSTILPLRFITPSDSYVTYRYEFLRERDTRSHTAERAPFSDTWFLVGDGRRTPEPIGFRLILRPGGMADAVAELDTVLALLPNVTSVQWRGRVRGVLGLANVRHRQILMGYQVEVEFWPSGPTWTVLPFTFSGHVRGVGVGSGTATAIVGTPAVVAAGTALGTGVGAGTAAATVLAVTLLTLDSDQAALFDSGAEVEKS